MRLLKNQSKQNFSLCRGEEGREEGERNVSGSKEWGEKMGTHLDIDRSHKNILVVNNEEGGLRRGKIRKGREGGRKRGKAVPCGSPCGCAPSCRTQTCA